MSQLSFQQVKECFNNNERIDWHEEFEREAWKDAPGPLTITGLSEIDWSNAEGKSVKCGFIKYKCSNSNCRLCTDESLTLQGHHKVIRLDGLDPFGRVEFKETKKKTIVSVVDQPVFRRADV